jgi:UTP-glucose-1-phosphate uridylyltransferase
VIHDCGSKLGWLQANLDLGLKAADIGRAFAAYARSRLA